VPTIISDDFEATMLRRLPTIEHTVDLNAAVVKVKAAGRLLGPVAGVTFDPQPTVGHRS
jgi:hypothetical protein